jgi:hypothetical protein
VEVRRFLKEVKRKGTWEIFSITSVITVNNVIGEEVLVNRQN